ncbi:MAG TPA: radical SAM protein [Clostridia bacterium]|nr:radical SAM protein [Clostridia bacterium]
MYGSDAIHYPQDEMNTVLLPVTSGCIYNKCVFCSMYKDEEYSEVSFSDIEMQLMNTDTYTEKLFLVGSDPMSIGFEKMKQLLDMIHLHLPYCARVASYAAIRSIFKYSVEELSILHDAGLRLLYIGFETGRDDILKLMNKGHTVEQAIQQAKKLNEANLPFNSIVMYGIAGEGESVDNAVATAKMINQFTTEKFITMNLVVMEGSRLREMVQNHEYIPSGRRERLIEIRTFLENLKPKQPMLFDTTHPTNLVRMFGILPDERRRLIREIRNHIEVHSN